VIGGEGKKEKRHQLFACAVKCELCYLLPTPARLGSFIINWESKKEGNWWVARYSHVWFGQKRNVWKPYRRGGRRGFLLLLLLLLLASSVQRQYSHGKQKAASFFFLLFLSFSFSVFFSGQVWQLCAGFEAMIEAEECVGRGCRLHIWYVFFFTQLGEKHGRERIKSTTEQHKEGLSFSRVFVLMAASTLAFFLFFGGGGHFFRYLLCLPGPNPPPPVPPPFFSSPPLLCFALLTCHLAIERKRVDRHVASLPFQGFCRRCIGFWGWGWESLLFFSLPLFLS